MTRAACISAAGFASPGKDPSADAPSHRRSPASQPCTASIRPRVIDHETLFSTLALSGRAFSTCSHVSTNHLLPFESSNTCWFITSSAFATPLEYLPADLCAHDLARHIGLQQHQHVSHAGNSKPMLHTVSIIVSRLAHLLRAAAQVCSEHEVSLQRERCRDLPHPDPGWPHAEIYMQYAPVGHTSAVVMSGSGFEGYLWLESSREHGRLGPAPDAPYPTQDPALPCPCCVWPISMGSGSLWRPLRQLEPLPHANVSA